MIGDLLGARPRAGSWEHTHGWPRAAGGLGERADRKGEQALQGEEPAELGECWGLSHPEERMASQELEVMQVVLRWGCQGHQHSRQGMQRWGVQHNTPQLQVT